MRVHVVSADVPKRVVGVAVLVDVFRSSSAIVTALANGARSVIPYTNIAEAIRFRNSRRLEALVLAGERQGITPKGFEYNISPLDMTQQNIGGKTILFSSTNLTRVLAKVRHPRMIIGCIINAQAAASYLRTRDRDVTIIACGTKQGAAIEDLAGAGALASYLEEEDLSDDALAAVGFYKTPTWRSLVRRGRTAKKLLALNLERDIDFSLSLNSYATVPVLKGHRIVRAED